MQRVVGTIFLTMLMTWAGCTETGTELEVSADIVPCKSDQDCLRSHYCDQASQSCQLTSDRGTVLQGCQTDYDCLRSDYCNATTHTCQALSQLPPSPGNPGPDPDDDTDPDTDLDPGNTGGPVDPNEPIDLSPDGDGIEGAPCTTGSVQLCGETNIGACTKVEQHCVDSKWTACEAIRPSVEICDGIDNNCDGRVDYQIQKDCGTDEGICRRGVSTCDRGLWGPCKGGIQPEEEICDGFDNNCDGQRDEGCVGEPPIADCDPSNIDAAPLDVVRLDGSGSVDPDGGILSYEWTVIVGPQGASSTPSPRRPGNGVSNFFVDLAGDYQVELIVTDNEGLTDSCIVDIHSIPPQSIHVQLVWAESWGDVDLHLTKANENPLGAFFDESSAEKSIWWLSTSGSWGANGLPGDASLDIDDVDGNGPENINIDVSPEIGTYHIGVHLYCADDLPPLKAKVRIYCGGILKDEIPVGWMSLNEVGEFWRPAQIEWNGTDCTVTRIDTIEAAAKYCVAAGSCTSGSTVQDCASYSTTCNIDSECRPYESCDTYWNECVLSDTCSTNNDCPRGMSCDTGDYAGICVR